MVAVLWGGAQQQQLATLEQLYNATTPHCAAGDWALGYGRLIVEEDGLSAVVELCACQGRAPPAAALHVLLRAMDDPESGGLHLTRAAHVLGKLAHRCAQLSALLSHARGHSAL